MSVLVIKKNGITPAANRQVCLKTVAEYFAGIGLVRMGLESQGWTAIFANDISEKKFEMYQTFFPDAASHYVIADIFKVSSEHVPNTILATCSFPCIDLSLAGNMNGIVDGKHSSAFWGFIRILRDQGDASPPFILVENVPGWLYSNEGSDFRSTVQSLNSIGYACDVFILDALRFTAQSRPRVFLIGSKLEKGHSFADSILGRPGSLLSQQLRSCLESNRDLHWFFNEIPEPPPLNRDGLSRVIERIPDSDSKWWSDTEVERHINMMKEPHKKRVRQLAITDQPAFRTFFRRIREGKQRVEVRPDDLSGCLRTAAGGSGKQFLICTENRKIKMRTMTPREYARLQGVPDRYRIEANGVQALTGFGDAVCVPAISWIAEKILNPLLEKHRSELETKFVYGRQSNARRSPTNDAGGQR